MGRVHAPREPLSALAHLSLLHLSLHTGAPNPLARTRGALRREAIAATAFWGAAIQ